MLTAVSHPADALKIARALWRLARGNARQAGEYPPREVAFDHPMRLRGHGGVRTKPPGDTRPSSRSTIAAPFAHVGDEAPCRNAESFTGWPELRDTAHYCGSATITDIASFMRSEVVLSPHL
jgi:hypothetical protein